MSRRARQPQPQQPEDDAASAVTSLTVVKSCSDTKETIQVPLSTTLGAFKELLSKHSSLGSNSSSSTPVSSLRLFYLGRELKTNGRTLAGLGVGRMGVNVLHMHSVSLAATKANKQPEISIDDDDDDDPIEVVEPQPSQRQQQRAAAASRSSSSKVGQQQHGRTASSSSESTKRGACVDLSAENNEEGSGRSKRRR